MKSTRAARYPEKLLLILGCCCVLLSAAVFLREGRKSDKPVTLAVPSATAHDKQEPPAKNREAALIGAQEARSSPAPGAAEKQEQPAKKEKETPAPESGSAAVRTIQETFDKGKAGQLPAGWSQWSSDRTNAFAISAEKFISKPHGLAVHGKSNTAARAWLKEPQPANAQASVAVFLNTLIPAELLVRGSRLDSGSSNCYAARVNRGLELKLVRVTKGEGTTLGSVKSAAYISEKWARLTVQAKGKAVSAGIQRLDTGDYLDATGQWRVAPTWAISVTDNEIAGEGQIGVGRPASYAGSVFFDDFMAGKATDDEAAVTEVKPTPKTSPAKPTEKPRPPSSASLPAIPVKLPEIPRHYKHIRIAMLAYYGNPMGEFEDKLLRESVDLLVPNPAYLKHVHAVAPGTPQLIYTNASNLYQALLTDWLAYADRKGISREAAFYHASRRVGFRGDSPSSQPVTWFWAVYRGGPRFTNLTTSARGRSGRVPFSGRGGALYLGYPERFREVNITLVSGAARGWSAVLEYPTQVDADGKPAQWQPLKMLGDATSGLTQSGRVTFDPPPDWKPTAVGGSAQLYYLRFRTSADGTAPVANTIIGRDYVEANGKTTGAIPVFDTKADANHDGYLDDGEYARRTPGKDARFVYESRMFTESYGQMRFGTNPSAAAFRAWAVDYHERMLKKEPLAGGFFMDNSEGKPPVKPAEVLEPLDSFAEDYGAMLHAISEAVAPKWLLANAAGGQLRADPVVRQNPAYFEEFAIRPLAHHFGYFEDLAALVARRGALTKPAPYAVIDSHPQNGTLTDPRMQMATLAYYYLIADPDSTFLMFYGGFEPATSWKRHWLPAVPYDVGKPTGKWSLFADGPDAAKPAFSYHVYQRPYERALVLYKPLSHARGSRERASIGPETTTKHELRGTYQPLQPDGTLGEGITTITLRNGEGAILVRSK